MKKIFMSLDGAFLYFTECHLATLEGARGRKSTSKSELNRLEGIAVDMVKAVMDWVPAPNRTYHMQTYPRLHRLIGSLAICALQELNGKHETQASATKAWDKMTAYEREQTLLAYNACKENPAMVDAVLEKRDAKEA